MGYALPAFIKFNQSLSLFLYLSPPLSLTGLDNCVNLEELHLENCCLTRLEGLNRLVKLRRLDLGHNLISALDAGVLEKLTSLTYLCLDNNKITSLAGLHRCVSLIELYLGTFMGLG